ncbi:chemotaxis response regulator protein-glutamate methylesterase [bacterium]|nr:chemotaxis response regulator protein-glutamate methylesterase [bacterium]
MARGKLRVLIVDSSPTYANLLAEALKSDGSIEIIGIASDAYEARDKIVLQRAELMIMDPDLPRMDGVSFLKRLMPQYPIPVIIITSKNKDKALEALDVGALDFIEKPAIPNQTSFIVELSIKIKIASTANLSHWKSKRDELPFIKRKADEALKHSSGKVIVLGASTGGTEAIKKIIPLFPSNMPPVVIVQHMPPGFTEMFANSLNRISHMEVKEATSGDTIMPGKVYIAPGDLHMSLVKNGNLIQLVCKTGERVSGHRPSVDVLMSSAATILGKNAIGIMLTGMGSDGAKGMLEMKKKGAYNIAQDEDSSIVYGMPKVAAELGGVDIILPLNDIAPFVIDLLED